MKVDYFESLTSIVPRVQKKSVFYYLDRIRQGESKVIVEKIRKEVDKKVKTELKKQLGAVTFAGTFSARNKKSILTSSGLCILDFDNTNDVIELKKEISQNKHCFAAWVSPSGNGVKALFKITHTLDADEYTKIFNKIVKGFDFDLDKSGQDICRLCFESYDPDLYFNAEAEIYIPVFEEVFNSPEELKSLGVITNIPLIDSDEIANKLMTWFKGIYNSSQRNTSIFKLAIALNDFGVPKSTAERYLGTYEQKDFDRREIQSIINSAYNHTSTFNTRFFEDKKKLKRIENIIRGGGKQTDVFEEFKDIDKSKIIAEIEIIKNNINIDEFWDRSEKNNIKIVPYLFKLYLENLRIFKYFPANNKKTFFFIKKDENFIDILTEFQIKDEVLNNMVKNNNLDVYNVLAERTNLFAINYLSMIDTASINILKDEKDFAILYYQNTAVKVFKDKIEVIDYNSFNDFIWKNTVINRDFEIDTDHHKSQFRSFVWYIAGQDRAKYETLKSVIGYLLHSYKTSNENKAIILNDETVSDNPNGGSGKGILINAIAKMKRTSVIDGKTFDFNKSFAFQTVNTDTQVLAFDDVKKNFEFERLFSVITEGITIEYKGKDAIKIPVTDSPKILISTNYTIKADGGSFERRMFEIEMSDYFGAKRTPLDHFGNLLFEDWSIIEWQRFDKFMINCLQYFLSHGLVSSSKTNLKLRKFINETSQEFHEYACIEKQIPFNCRINKTEFTEKYHQEYPDSRKFVTNRILNKWIKKYADYDRLEYLDGNSNGKRWFSLGEINQSEDLEIDNESKF